MLWDQFVEAAESGNSTTVGRLMAKYSVPDDVLMDAYELAAANGHKSVIYIIRIYADLVAMLKRASIEGRERLVKFLADEVLSNGAALGDLDKIKLAEGYGASDYNAALIDAARKGYVKVMEYLVSKGANEFNLALLVAANFGRVAAMRYLIEKGANNYKEALLSATGSSRYDVVEFLLSYYIMDVPEEALNIAVYNGYVDIVKLLLETGATVTDRQIRFTENELSGDRPKIYEKILNLLREYRLKKM